MDAARTEEAAGVEQAPAVASLVIYIAGPYSAPTSEGIAKNVRLAAEAGIEVMRRGHVALCPHTMTHNWDMGTGLRYEQFLAADLELLRRCDAVLMVGTWGASKGAVGEYRAALALGLPVYVGLEEVPSLD